MNSIKITKTDMVEAITEHLSALGRRMTNLKSQSVGKLEEVIKKYQIDINTFAIKRKEEMKLQRIKDKKAKEERRKKEEEEHCKRMESLACIDKLSMVINDELLINKYAVVREIATNHYWKVNEEKLIAENTKLIEETDRQFDMYKRELPHNAYLERVNENTINVRGVNVVYHYLNIKPTKKELMSDAKRDIMNCFKQDLYKVGILEELSKSNKYYINSKADYIISKKKREEEMCVNMITEIEEYVKKKYANLLQKYKMEFTKKFGGVL